MKHPYIEKAELIRCIHHETKKLWTEEGKYALSEMQEIYLAALRAEEWNLRRLALLDKQYTATYN